MMHDSKSVARLFAAPFTVWAVLFIVLPLFFVLYHGLTDGERAFTLANLWEAVQMEYLRALGLSVESHSSAPSSASCSPIRSA